MRSSCHHFNVSFSYREVVRSFLAALRIHRLAGADIDRQGRDKVDEQRGQPDEERDAAMGSMPFAGDVERAADDAPYPFVSADLSLAADETMWRQTAEFADVARELRDIIRGIHLFTDG